MRETTTNIRPAGRRPFPAIGVAVALTFLCAACAIPRPRLSGPVPSIPPLPQTSLMFDATGRLLDELHAGENRTLVPLAAVPTLVQRAVIDIEDVRFYQHHGVDFKAILRAAIANAKAGTIVQGGSTIAEQLVKNTITGSDRTLANKFRQAELAYALENRYSKDQILGLYLNTVYFGEGAYGIQAAAQTYFSVDASQLTLTQGAMLAGVIQAPSSYDPVFAPGAALARRDVVLARMRDVGSISAGTYAVAVRTPLGLATSNKASDTPSDTAPYFVEYVKNWFLSDPRFGATRADRYDLLFKGGLRIYTTVDPHLQALADQAVRTILVSKADPHAAMTVIDPTTGEIRAMVGGRGFTSNDPIAQVNLASGQGGTGRQPGSAFKPFTLVAAMEHGISPQQVYAAPPTIQIPLPNGTTWNLANFEGQSFGSMSLEDATIQSVNTVYAQVVQQVGPEKVVATAHAMGITSPLDAVPSITLGTSEVNTVEMASAYGTLATLGYHVQPTAVSKITDATGRAIYQADEEPRLVVQPGIASTVDRILQEVVQRGTGVQANIGRPAAGKTGTTQDNKDAWFVGFTPQLVAAVWVGFPEPAPMVAPRVRIPVVLGGTWPAEIWHAFMTNATRDLPPLDFTTPHARYVTVVVDVTQGCLPNQYTPPQDIQPVQYVAGTEPTTVCTEPDSPQQVGTPQVVGMTEDQARAELESFGFRVVVEPIQAPGLAVGTVLSQSPPAGSQAYPGDTVIIVVAADPSLPPG